MRAQNKKSKRTYRLGRLYYCSKCDNYSWLHAIEGILRSMWKPENTGKATGRTCNDCRADA